MWILNFLPHWIFYFLVIAGVTGLVASAVLKFIPLVSTYRLPIQVISSIALLVGVYFQGAIATQKEWEAKVKDLEAKLAVAEARSSQVNEIVKVEYRDKIKVVKDVQIVVQEKIKEVTKILDQACTVPPEAVDILNSAANNTNPGQQK